MRFKSVLFSGLLCSGFATAWSDDAKPLPAILENLDSFSQITKNWRYDCWQPYLRVIDPDIDVHLRNFMQPVILEGLRRLHGVNPGLVESSLQAKNSMPLAVTCYQDNNSAAAIALQWDKSSGEFRIGGMAHDLAVHHSPGALSKLGKTQDNSKFAKERGYYEITVFHEYLHALELDNLSNADHSWMIRHQPQLREKDVVYACAAQAYASPHYALMRGTGYALFSNTKTACETCARAVWNKAGGLSSLDFGPAGSQRAAQACADFDPEKYLFYEY